MGVLRIQGQETGSKVPEGGTEGLEELVEEWPNQSHPLCRADHCALPSDYVYTQKSVPQRPFDVPLFLQLALLKQSDLPS